MSKWDKLKPKLVAFIQECNCMTNEDYQIAFDAVAEGDKLQEENKRYGRLQKSINKTCLEQMQKLEAIQEQIVEPTLKESKEYLDTHNKPEPHNIEMALYWGEKACYAIALDIQKILEAGK